MTLALYGPRLYKGADWAPSGIVYHYTRGDALRQILSEGASKTTGSLLASCFLEVDLMYTEGIHRGSRARTTRTRRWQKSSVNFPEKKYY